MSRSSAFVDPIDEKSSALSDPLNVTSTSVTNVFNWADSQPLVAVCFWIRKRQRDCHDIPKDDNPQSRKLLSRFSARRPEVLLDLLIAMYASIGNSARAFLLGRVSPQQTVPTHVGSLRDANSTPADVTRVPRLPTALSLSPKRAALILPPVSSVSTILCCLLLAWSFHFRRFDGLCGSVPSPSFPFLSVPEYIFCYWDRVNRQRHATIPRELSFHERFRPSGVNRKILVPACAKVVTR